MAFTKVKCKQIHEAISTSLFTERLLFTVSSVELAKPPACLVWPPAVYGTEVQEESQMGSNSVESTESEGGCSYTEHTTHIENALFGFLGQSNVEVLSHVEVWVKHYQNFISWVVLPERKVVEKFTRGPLSVSKLSSQTDGVVFLIESWTNDVRCTQ